MRAAIWFGLALLLVSCAGGRDARPNAERIAAAAGLRRMDISTPQFQLVAYARFGAGPVLRVYIEGDGHAFVTRDEPSDDPTPRSPVALELAARDTAPSVAYLGRPCQYVAPGSDPQCGVYYWTDGRYAEPVVASMNAAIDQLQMASGARSIELVGFSGGGVIAALIAARRTDVANLRTVAANLDTATWTATLGLSPLTGSLNPADFATRLQNLPQMHFIGRQDTVVEPTIIRAYRTRFQRLDCVRETIVPSAGHREGWSGIWPELLRQPVRCSAD